MRNDNGLDQVDRGGSVEAWLGSGYILKSAEFAEGWVLRYGRKVLKMILVFLSWTTRRMELPFIEMEETRLGVGETGDEVFHFAWDVI